MIAAIAGIVSAAALGLGSLLLLSGALGLLRFPDFYTRVHASGITDTLATGLIVAGLMPHAGWSQDLTKLILILVFIVFVSPTAVQVLVKSALHGGLVPVTRKSS